MKRDSKKEKYDLTLCDIYETLSEIEIQSKNFQTAFSYLEKASEILDSINIEENMDFNTSDEKEMIEKHFLLKNKINVLTEFIEQKNYENNKTISSESQNTINNNNNNNNQNSSNINKINSIVSNTNLGSVTNKKKIKIDDAEDDKLLADFLSTDYQPEISREVNTNELKNFYLFISSLSEKQIRQLNMDQPKNFEQTKKLPIVFTKEFKESLNHIQRYQFTQLRLSNLSRVRVLRNYHKKIKIKNLNYNDLYVQVNKPVINVINSNYETKKILKNWESEKVEPIKTKKESIEWDNKKENKEIEKKIEVVNVPKKEKLNKKEMEKLCNEILGRELIEYDKFKNYVLYYFKENAPERLNTIDDDFILLLTREMERENLKKIILNPETLNDILDTYLIYKEENFKQIKEEERIREKERKEKEEEEKEEEEERLNRLVTIKRITFDGL